jgi:hypothetical protein
VAAVYAPDFLATVVAVFNPDSPIALAGDRRSYALRSWDHSVILQLVGFFCAINEGDQRG